MMKSGGVSSAAQVYSRHTTNGSHMDDREIPGVDPDLGRTRISGDGAVTIGVQHRFHLHSFDR